MSGLLGALIACGLASLVLYEAAPSTHWPAALRIACAIGLVVLARVRASGRSDGPARFTLLALALAGAGDSLLAVSPEWPKAFLIAMGLFLGGHLALIVAFGRTELSPLKSSLTLLPIAAYALVVLTVLTPFLGALRFPVTGYVAVLSLMAWRACLVAQDVSRPRAHRVALAMGAVLFIVADTLLAFDKFHQAIPHEKVLAMVPYWTSLACFAVPIAAPADSLAAASPA